MSDRMTNMEIEDLLSSIRRLVSEDGREAPARMPPKLVLTAAERVRPAVQARPAEPDGGSLEARIAELEAMLRARAQAFEPDEGDAFGARIPDAAMAADTPPPGAQGDAVAAVAGGRADAPAAQGRAAPDVPPAEPQWEEVEPEQGASARISGDADRQPRSGADTDETDEDDDDDIVFPDAVEMSDTIDEQMLRDIVRDILRDELQGALGERITRNVRKLVRTEIARALASRSLD